MELLAPAGSFESLQAAVRCGADAVYLGASSFNARRNASNFDSLSLADAVQYCHGRHVRVYVTLNTLIFDSEIKDFTACLNEVLDAGPDSLIVQDLGALHVIRSVCPDIPVCASTQMSICNADGAHILEDLGITQAVLARELSLEEIRSIHSQTGIKLETFVHGAHCMSVSGLCYFSSALGERSGNRGLCAQPCRMDFRCRGREYALSLKDLSFVDHVQELKEAGVATLKIEGRMKRPEYVAAAVTAVRQALRGEKPDMEDLRRVFSRSGFTDGYLTGKRNAKMFGIRSQEDISASKEILGRMASLYRHELMNVPVDMVLHADQSKIHLSVSDGTHKVCSECATVTSDTGCLTSDIIDRSLRKTGNTPYCPANIVICAEPDLHVPSSLINGLKKSALEDLLRKSSVGICYNRNVFIPETLQKRGAKSPVLRARFSNFEQIVFPELFDLVILPVEEIDRKPELLNKMPICAELPTVLWPGSQKPVDNMLIRLSALGLKHVIAGNVGWIDRLKGMGFTVHGDSTLNITNSFALMKYAEFGLADTVLSSELTLRQAESISGKLGIGVYGYGRMPLMFFRSCPARTETGCGKCPGRSQITDRLHNTFPVICHQRLYSVMHNSVPLYLGDSERPNVDFIGLYFTAETKAEAASIIGAFNNGDKLRTAFTRGHAFSPVR